MVNSVAQARDPASLRYPIAIVGAAACFAMLFVSATMNYRFGFGLATSAADGWLYGMLSASADILKVVVPFVVLWAAREKIRWVWRTALCVLVVSALYGWAGAAGHFSKNRLETAGDKVLQSDNYKDLRADKARTEEALKWLGAHRGVDAVRSDMNGIKAKNMRLWTSSSECVEPSGGNAREFCQNYFKLSAELGNAQQAEKYQARIDEIAAKLGKVGGAAASSAEGGDAQAGTLSKLTFGVIGVGTMQVLLVLVGIACLELGGGFGPFCFFAYAFGISLHAIVLKDDEKEEKEKPATAATPGVLIEATIEAPKPTLALPKPAEIKAVPVPPTSLPEPSPEWRSLLDGLDFYAPHKGALRAPIDRKVLGYHWLAFLYAYGKVGNFEAGQVDRLYDEFCLAAWREQGNGVNVAKGELRQAALKLDKKAITVRDNRTPTIWTIQMKSPVAMRKLLTKRGILVEKAKATEVASADPTKTADAKPAKETASGAEVVPFPHSNRSASGAASPAPSERAANDDTPRAPAPIRGRAELQVRFVPNLEAMRHLERQQKAHWQSRSQTPNRKSMNRMRMARAA